MTVGAVGSSSLGLALQSLKQAIQQEQQVLQLIQQVTRGGGLSSGAPSGGRGTVLDILV